MRLALTIAFAILGTGILPVHGAARLAKAQTPTPSSLPTAAVLDLISAPEHSDLAAWVAESIGAELTESGQMKVLERRRMVDVLREQAALGIELGDDTAARLGRGAGASRLVTGRLTRVGSGFQVDVSLLDASDAKVLATATARFNTRDAVPLAAREVVWAMVEGERLPALDEEKLREAASEIARRIGQRFPRARTRITSLSPTGWATLSGGSARGLVPGLRMDVFGKDFVTGEREVRGYLLVRQADQNTASGPSKALTEPLRIGDEVVARRATFVVTGEHSRATEAVRSALSSVSHLEPVESGEANLSIEIEVVGPASGSRRLRAKLVDREGVLLSEIQGMQRF